jgi:hypothetical protein
MKREFRLTEEDLLSEEHFPVMAVFDMIPDNRFVKTIKCISEGHGFGENYGACTFPADLDEYDIATIGTLNGVEFGLHNGQEITLDYNTFYCYLKKVCVNYIQDFPEDANEISNLLLKFKTLFMIHE